MTLQHERDVYRAVLEGAEFENLDLLLQKDVAFARAVGETVARRVKRMVNDMNVLGMTVAQVEAERDGERENAAAIQHQLQMVNTMFEDAEQRTQQAEAERDQLYQVLSTVSENYKRADEYMREKYQHAERRIEEMTEERDNEVGHREACHEEYVRACEARNAAEAALAELRQRIDKAIGNEETAYRRWND